MSRITEGKIYLMNRVGFIKSTIQNIAQSWLHLLPTSLPDMSIPESETPLYNHPACLISLTWSHVATLLCSLSTRHSHPHLNPVFLILYHQQRSMHHLTKKYNPLPFCLSMDLGIFQTADWHIKISTKYTNGNMVQTRKVTQ